MFISKKNSLNTVCRYFFPLRNFGVKLGKSTPSSFLDDTKFRVTVANP